MAGGRLPSKECRRSSRRGKVQRNEDLGLEGNTRCFLLPLTGGCLVAGVAVHVKLLDAGTVWLDDLALVTA